MYTGRHTLTSINDNLNIYFTELLFKAQRRYDFFLTGPQNKYRWKQSVNSSGRSIRRTEKLAVGDFFSFLAFFSRHLVSRKNLLSAFFLVVHTLRYPKYDHLMRKSNRTQKVLLSWLQRLLDIFKFSTNFRLFLRNKLSLLGHPYYAECFQFWQ